jgi:hypothetical protein
MSLVEVSTPQQDNEEYRVTSVDVMSIRSNGFVIYKESLLKRGQKEMKETQLANLKLKGKVSWIKSSSVKRIEKFLTNWMKAIIYENEMRRSVLVRREHYPIFVTLTLPAQQIHSDQLIKRQVLMPFLQEAKRKWKMKHYFWRAELQKNYNIHFHLVMDVYVNKEELQQAWNAHCESLGYLSRFEKKFNHRNPPSTHVEAIRDVEKMTNYVCKYITKDSGEIAPDGKKWDASEKLKEYKNKNYHLDSYLCDWISKLIDEEKIQMYEGEHFAIAKFTKKFDWVIDYGRLWALEHEDLLDMYRYLYTDVKVTNDVIKKKEESKKCEPRQMNLFPIDYSEVH